MKTIIAVAAVLFAGPAIAQQPAEPTPAITAPIPSGGTAAPRAKPTRYCVVTEITGSRIPNKRCRTREAWLVEGFDPLADRGR